MYKGRYESSFSFEHCWNELRYQPKLMEELEIKQQKTKKTATAINLEDTNETPGLKQVDLERPPERKAKKERQNKRKRSDGGNEGL
ncbi:hypothetical protein RHGRI_016425 [Rhododendron griersonianum]|uniref:No apical meristem-associated C-terminal domain-containing protein n=1 Tax=Rhododendron griersonianum TaxID=479676 RepID=A0AAV6JU18_9ERIC|nr:hypothetical protein RHGRI_016425 [Rhododendron griersonianum]